MKVYREWSDGAADRHLRQLRQRDRYITGLTVLALLLGIALAASLLVGCVGSYRVNEPGQEQVRR